MEVLWTELGVAILTILERSIALVPSYLYPHLTGRYESFMPGKPSVLHEKVQAKMLAYAMVCLSKLITSSKRWTTFATSSEIYMYMKGAPLISSPPDGSKKEKGASSPFRLSQIDLS